mgnify:CR=1 FL=1
MRIRPIWTKPTKIPITWTNMAKPWSNASLPRNKKIIIIEFKKNMQRSRPNKIKTWMKVPDNNNNLQEQCWSITKIKMKPLCKWSRNRRKQKKICKISSTFSILLFLGMNTSKVFKMDIQTNKFISKSNQNKRFQKSNKYKMWFLQLL